ncbi:MAG: hypothetical protein ACJ76F_00155, partial [Bacteroidia bacterium]
MKSFLLTLALFTLHTIKAQIENKTEYRWNCGITINSIQGQVEFPLSAGGGGIIMDSDGNMVNSGRI